jgi:hypothetical protein
LKVFEFNVYPKFANKAVVQLFTANFISWSISLSFNLLTITGVIAYTFSVN